MKQFVTVGYFIIFTRLVLSKNTIYDYKVAATTCKYYTVSHIIQPIVTFGHFISFTRLVLFCNTKRFTLAIVQELLVKPD